MTHKTARALAGLAMAALACGGGRSRPRFARAPVVLISIDTLRSDHLPAYGYRALETPHLDRFRRDAILFRHAYSPCPMTLPSHLTMLTGLQPPEHGVRNNIGFAFRSADHASLPTILKKQGYATGAAISSYVLRGETGLAAAFDFYEDSIRGRAARSRTSSARDGRRKRSPESGCRRGRTRRFSSFSISTSRTCPTIHRSRFAAATRSPTTARSRPPTPSSAASSTSSGAPASMTAR